MVVAVTGKEKGMVCLIGQGQGRSGVVQKWGQCSCTDSRSRFRHREGVVHRFAWRSRLHWKTPIHCMCVYVCGCVCMCVQARPCTNRARGKVAS